MCDGDDTLFSVFIRILMTHRAVVALTWTEIVQPVRRTASAHPTP